MSTVQFEPKISTDLPINWHRPASGQAADMFADLLADRMKQNAGADHRPSAPKRHQPASDPLAGRPSRVVIAHPRTIRGEAKEVEDTGTRLADQRDCAADEECAPVTDETPVVGEDTEAGSEQETADTGTETEASAGTEEVVEAAVEQVPPQDAEAVIVVATQPAEQAEVSGEAELALALPLPDSAEGEALAPVPAEDADAATTGGSQENTDAAVQQQAIGLLAEAELAAVAATLTDGEAATPTAVEAPAVVTQPTAAPAVAAPAEEPLAQMLEAVQPVAEPVPAPAQPQADKHPMDIKLRPGLSRAQSVVPDPKPGATPAPQAQPHQVTPLQPATAGDFEGAGDMLDQPFSPEGSGPGWTLHLAQGAAAKRPDFVAQLRQHLQNLPAHEQVAVHVQRAVREGTGRFSVQLSPAELGHIHVKLEIDEDKRVTAAVTVERPSTLELLQRDIKGLERALHNAGLSLEGGDLSFSLGRGSDQEFAQDLNQSAAPAAGGTVTDAESDGEQAADAAQVMDTAAGVVNLQV